MAKSDIVVKKAETVFDEIDRLHQAVSKRAYELFRNGGTWGGALTDWFTAERELVSKPAIELSQKDGQFEVLAAVPGLEAKDLEVQITQEDLLIKGETSRESKSDKGNVHVSEFESGKLFRSVRFPESVDPDTVKAELKNGMLQITASIAKSATKAKAVEIKAA